MRISGWAFAEGPWAPSKGREARLFVCPTKIGPHYLRLSALSGERSGPHVISKREEEMRRNKMCEIVASKGQGLAPCGDGLLAMKPVLFFETASSSVRGRPRAQRLQMSRIGWPRPVESRRQVFARNSIGKLRQNCFSTSAYRRFYTSLATL